MSQKKFNLKHVMTSYYYTRGSIESIFVELITETGKNIIIGVIYRPPNGKIDIFEKVMSEILSKTDKENKICYLMGDFNIDLLKSDSCDYMPIDLPNSYLHLLILH